MPTPEPDRPDDGEVYTLLPHEAARTITGLRARVAELEATIARALTVDRDYMDALARATAAEAQVAAVREALDELAVETDKRRGYREIQAAERAGLIMAISRVREALDAASTPANSQPAPTSANTGSWPPAVTDAMVQAAINAALERSGHLQQHIVCDWCHLNSPYPRYAGPARQRVFRAALEAALGTPATEPDASLTPHSGQDCPNRIEVTGWGMTDREWICGCDPRPDATAPAETTSPSEAP